MTLETLASICDDVVVSLPTAQATDKLGPPVSARPIVSYTISWDISFFRLGARP